MLLIFGRAGSAPTREQIGVFAHAETIVLGAIIGTDEMLHPLFGDGLETLEDAPSRPTYA